MKITYNILGMHCSNCAILPENIEDELSGINSADASFRKQEFSVDFNESLVSDEQIVDKIIQKGCQVKSKIIR